MAVIVIRADASVEIGTGHVMRCLAVAQALQDEGYDCVFATAAGTSALDARLKDEGFGQIRLPGPPGGPGDLGALLALLDRLDPRGVIIDGYGFNPAYRAALWASASERGASVLAFDDTAEVEALHADIVVNAALHAERLPYVRIAAGARLLVGPSHAPLRREVRLAAGATLPSFEQRDSILLTFGGSDPFAFTGPCLERLAPTLPAGARLVAVTGGSNPLAGEIAALGAKWPDRVLTLHDTPSMGALMAQAGLAVSAGGGTTAELAALRVPTLLVVVADNQALAAEASSAGWCEVIDARKSDATDRVAQRALDLWRNLPARRRMAEAAGGLVDGMGAMRIARALLTHRA